MAVALMVASIVTDTAAGVVDRALSMDNIAGCTAVMLAVSYYEDTISVDGIELTSADIDGTPLTQLSVSSNGVVRNHVWAISRPTTSFFNGMSLSFYFTGDPLATVALACAGFSLSGATGFDSTAFGTPVKATGTDTTPTVSVVKVSDEGLVVGSLGVDLTLVPPGTTITVGSGETEINNNQSVVPSNRAYNEGSYETTPGVTGDTITIDPTLSVSKPWSIIALEVIGIELQDVIECSGIIPFPR